MKTHKLNCLILGGSYFIGKTFLKKLKDNDLYHLYVANRGTKETQSDSSIQHIKLDRNEIKSCEILSNYHFDIVIDFSCWSITMLQNVIQYLQNPYYIFISSGYAELTDQNHPDYDYGNQKFQCENCIQQHFTESLIIRPGFVVGDEDHTKRFYKHPDIDLYYHKETSNIVMPHIEVNMLASSILHLMKYQETGLVKMGYV